MKFSQNNFNDFILDNKVVGFFPNPIKLKSGRESNWYVNWRIVGEDVFLLDELSNFVVNFTSDLVTNSNLPKIDTFFGVPEGATKVGLLSQYKLAKSSDKFSPGSHVLSMGRGHAKEHGAERDKYFLGVPKGNTLIIEDVTTTGGSLISTIDALKKSEVRVVGAIGLTNRMELRDDGRDVKEAINSLGIPYFQMSNAKEILPLAIERLKPDASIVEKIRVELLR